MCGSNNCLKFGLYYHDKDDCCEKPSGRSVAGVVTTKKGEVSVAGSVGLRSGSA